MSENTMDLLSAVSCTMGRSKPPLGLGLALESDISIFQSEMYVSQGEQKKSRKHKSVKLADTPDSVHAGCPTRDRH